MSNADAIVERLRLLVSRRTGQSPQNNKSDDSALRMALWDLHNHIPQNLEVFEIWQGLNSAKRDPERFEVGVSRLVVFLRSYQSPQNARPSQFGIVQGGEDAHSLRQNDPRANAIGVHSLGVSDTTRPQPPEHQPLFHSLSQAAYVEVQDVGKMPHSLSLDAQYFNRHATAKIPSREEHTLMPSSVPIEIAPESGGRPPYGGLNRDGYDTQPPTSATGGSALHSQYSAVPELMEPAIPPPTTQSETPKTTSGSAPPSGPHHTTLLEPMATDIHPSYYESAVHQRVSSTGIMSVTPVLRARTPARSPDDGLVYGASASRSLSQRDYRQPSQHISSGLQSSPTSDQKAGSGNPPHAQLNDCLPVSPNKWPESGLLRIIASPISGGHTERPVTSSAPVDESSPSAAGYEESPRQAVSPSTTENRSPTQRRAPAGARLNHSPSLTRRTDPLSAPAPRLVGSVPGNLPPNSAVEPSAFHGVYAASRYPYFGDTGIPSRLPVSRVMPNSLLAVQQETALHDNSSSVISSNGSLQAHAHSTPGSGSPYVPAPSDQNIPIQHLDPNEAIWPPGRGQQDLSSNMSGALASQLKTYHPPPSNDEGRYNSVTNYTSTVAHDQTHPTSHESQGLRSSQQEPQPALWNIPPPGTQPRLPIHRMSTTNGSQYEPLSSYTSSLSHSQTVPTAESDSPFWGSQIASNITQASGTLHISHLAQPPTGNINQYNSSSSSFPPNHNQNNISPQHMVQSHLPQGSQPAQSGISQYPRVQPESSVPQAQYNPAPSSNVLSGTYGQTRNQAPSSSFQPPESYGSRQNSINHPVLSNSLTGYSMPNTMPPTFPTQSNQQSNSSAPPPPPPTFIASPYNNQYVDAQAGNPLAGYAGISTSPQHYRSAIPPGQQQFSVSQHVDPPSSVSSSPHTLQQRGSGPPYSETQNNQAQADQMNQVMSAIAVGTQFLRGVNLGMNIVERINQD